MIDIAKIRCDFDTQLMLRVKRGDEIAYTILYEKYLLDVINFFAKVGIFDGWSEDLAQEVFTCIWKDRKSFRAESTFKTYMYGIAKVILKKHMQYLRQEAEISKISGISHIKEELSQPEAEYSYVELSKNIEINISKLSEKQRYAIELSIDPDLTPEMAAHKAGCSYNTLRQRRFAARKKLKNS